MGDVVYILVGVFATLAVVLAVLYIFVVRKSRRNAQAQPPAGLRQDEQYQNLDAQGQDSNTQGAGGQKQQRHARYEPGMKLHRNLQDPSVAFKFGGEVGTLEGDDSVGESIVIDCVYVDDKGDLKYRVKGAKASCKTTVLEKHFDRRDGTNVRQLGDVVMRNNVDRKMEFNMKGKLGVVRPGTVATVASVFVDRDGEVKYTLKGAINWLPESKFIRYFSKVDSDEDTERAANTSQRRAQSMVVSEVGDDELKETLLAS